MAAKKSATKTKKSASAATTTKAPAKKASVAKAPKAPAEAAVATATKPKPAATKVAAKKPLKLSDAQEKFLRLIDDSGETGYSTGQKTELRTIEKLREHKLVKRGAKDKVSGNTPYMTTAAGKKHLAAQSPA